MKNVNLFVQTRVGMMFTHLTGVKLEKLAQPVSVATVLVGVLHVEEEEVGGAKEPPVSMGTSSKLADQVGPEIMVGCLTNLVMKNYPSG